MSKPMADETNQETTTSYEGTWSETPTEEDAADLAMMAEAEREFDESGGIPVEDVLKRVRTNQEAGEPMTPNPRAEGWRVSGVAVHRGSEMFVTADRVEAEKLAAHLNDAAMTEALAGLATKFREYLRRWGYGSWCDDWRDRYDQLAGGDAPDSEGEKDG